MADAALTLPTPTEIRQELQDLILGELLGPAGGPDEEVEESRLTERYLLGMLAPQRVAATAEEDDSLGTEGSASPEEESESTLPVRASFFPSSFGMTFAVEGSVERLRVEASWGRYKREEPGERREDGPSRVWRRYPSGGTAEMPLVEGPSKETAPDPDHPQVILRGRARRHDGDWLVTLFLVNTQQEPKDLRDEAWLFQAGFSVSDPEGRPILRRRPMAEDPASLGADAQETRTLAMLYRDEVEFGVGHGVSVHAEPDTDDPRRAFRISTAAAPAYEVPRTDPPTEDDIPEIAGVTLDMQGLAEAEPADLPGMLTPLVDAYEAWIEREAGRIGDVDARFDGFEDVADAALEKCREAAQRIRMGIDLLADPEAAEAFRFANRAMWQQRVRSRAAEDRRRDPSLSIDDAVAARDVPEERSWRPFQLAFILLNLPALTQPTHPERGTDEGLVDLLWFPTGGGKTEAYLGLIAYTLGIRRLQGEVAGRDGSQGVAAIMRYTLRLLTIQQFQRAAALICACESIRREDEHRWGETPFRIGLWVGLRATPNTTEDADRWLKQARGATGYQGGQGGQGGSPAQLTSCPWCGSTIEERRHIKVDMDLKRTFLYCGDRLGKCAFTERQSPEGLPVLVVDEEIYRNPPSLLIGTVDKFAQMPWKGPIQNLFGRVSSRCTRHGFRAADLEDSDSHPKRGALPPAKTVPATPLRPPDLIIQDELHLIAGPLGSMVGLYETAVDQLCTWEVDEKQVRPKVIASTATVRRAAHQAHGLFLRKLEVFPPPGLDARDSFFALQREVSEEVPGRRYLGICAQGRQFKGVLIRVYVAEMAAAQFLFEKYGGAVDPYMTLVGYFNSLKDLGGMRRHVDDDVSSRLGRIDRRGLARRQRPFVEELTSRRGSGDIPRVLDQLGVKFVKDRDKGSPAPIDVLLATNMISVGIDVPRLGAMVVAGQPKATAEYIQATSRIGRSFPGLVLTVYGWARPRDLSHYERFEHYHATFYRQVEALSVTPFAPRALDRGLTALLVSLARHSDEVWNPEPAAGTVDTHSQLPKEIIDVVKKRTSGVMSRVELEKEVETALQARLDLWAAKQAVPNRQLAYKSRRDGVTVGLIHAPGVQSWDEWTALTSLRDVEPGVNLLLIDDDLNEKGRGGYDFTPAEEDA